MARVSINHPIDYLLGYRSGIGANPTYPLSYVLTCNTSDGSTLNESVSATI